MTNNSEKTISQATERITGGVLFVVSKPTHYSVCQWIEIASIYIRI